MISRMNRFSTSPKHLLNHPDTDMTRPSSEITENDKLGSPIHFDRSPTLGDCKTRQTMKNVDTLDQKLVTYSDTSTDTYLTPQKRNQKMTGFRDNACSKLGDRNDKGSDAGDTNVTVSSVGDRNITLPNADDRNDTVSSVGDRNISDPSDRDFACSKRYSTVPNGAQMASDRCTFRSNDSFDNPLSSDDFDDRAQGGVPFNKNKLHRTEDILELIKNSSTSLKSIPLGVKENVMFLIDSMGEKPDFSDDCGAYVSKQTRDKYCYFKAPETRSTFAIYKQNEIYCRKKYVNRKPIFELLTPQPSTEYLFTVWRKKRKLKANPSYEKLILHTGISNVFIVRYSGHFPRVVSTHRNFNC